MAVACSRPGYLFPAISPPTIVGLLSAVVSRRLAPSPTSAVADATISAVDVADESRHPRTTGHSPPVSFCSKGCDGSSIPGLPLYEGDGIQAGPEPASSKANADLPAPDLKPITCDKCDGKHETSACPHFKKPRDTHKDAWVNYGRKHPKQFGNSGGNFVLRGGARRVAQPGDGSCLFHALCFGLNQGLEPGSGLRAGELRRDLMEYISSHPQVEIAGDTLEEWIRWDANASVTSYTRQMAAGGWGGGIEMAACSLLKHINVHVYERRWLGGFKRISCFDSPDQPAKTIHVLYQGGVHYDAIALS